MNTPIWVSKGKKRYVGGTITETTGKDISADVVTVGLVGSSTIPPDTFGTPDVDLPGAAVSQRIAKKLIDASTPLGTYWCWGNIEDNPEIEPFVLSGPHVVC
jgi:hypothetical protein